MISNSIFFPLLLSSFLIKTNAQNDPIGRIGQSSAIINDTIYIFGGNTSSGTVSSEAYSFDLTNSFSHRQAISSKLTQLPNLPQPITFASAVERNNRIYIIGGQSPQICNDSFSYFYNPTDNSFSSSGLSSIFGLRTDGTAFPSRVDDDSFYFFGGDSPCIVNNSVYMYNYTTLFGPSIQQSDLPIPTSQRPLPQANAAATSLSVRQDNSAEILVLGGRTDYAAREFKSLEDLQIFDTRANTWRYEEAVFANFTADPRIGHSLITTSDNKIILFGGMTSQTSPSYPQLLILDTAPMAKTWSAPNVSTVFEGARPPPLAFHSAFYIPETELMVVMFGLNPESQDFNTEMYVYNIRNNTWLEAYPGAHVSSDALAWWIIVLIILGVIVLLLILCCIAAFFVRRRRANRKAYRGKRISEGSSIFSTRRETPVMQKNTRSRDSYVDDRRISSISTNRPLPPTPAEISERQRVDRESRINTVPVPIQSRHSRDSRSERYESPVPIPSPHLPSPSTRSHSPINLLPIPAASRQSSMSGTSFTSSYGGTSRKSYDFMLHNQEPIHQAASEDLNSTVSMSENGRHNGRSRWSRETETTGFTGSGSDPSRRPLSNIREDRSDHPQAYQESISESSNEEITTTLRGDRPVVAEQTNVLRRPPQVHRRDSNATSNPSLFGLEEHENESILSTQHSTATGHEEMPTPRIVSSGRPQVRQSSPRRSIYADPVLGSPSFQSSDSRSFRTVEEQSTSTRSPQNTISQIEAQRRPPNVPVSNQNQRGGIWNFQRTMPGTYESPSQNIVPQVSQAQNVRQRRTSDEYDKALV